MLDVLCHHNLDIGMVASFNSRAFCGPVAKMALLGGLRWAKIAGHPLWPAWIATPDKHDKPDNGRALELVQFFGKAAGTAWLLEKNWKRPYMQQRDEAIKQAKQVLTKPRFLVFEAAVREADEHFAEMIETAREDEEEESSKLDDDANDINEENQQERDECGDESEDETEEDEEMDSEGDSSAMHSGHRKSSSVASRHDDDIDDADDNNDGDDDGVGNNTDSDNNHGSNDDITQDEEHQNDADHEEEDENQMAVNEKIHQEKPSSKKENENETVVEEAVAEQTPSTDNSPEGPVETPATEKHASRRFKSKKMSEIERLALSRNVSFRPSELVLADATSFAGIGCGRSRRRMRNRLFNNGGGASGGGGSASSCGNASMMLRVPAFQVKDRIEALWDGGPDLYAGTISDVSMDLAAGPIYKIK